MTALVELGARWDLDPGQVAQLARVLELLADDETAPTSVRPPAAVDVHIADSLSALQLDCVRGAGAIADLGSGAGFPGIVLAIALPRASVALVESAARKCVFLEALATTAGVANARVVCARAEEWRDGLAAHDLVVARALARLDVVCEYAAPLLAVGGSLVAWKGSVSDGEAEAAARAAKLLGLVADRTVRSEPYSGSVAHHLHVFRKTQETPAAFPRRTGVAAKRPIGSPDR
ncbi:MAG: 16S rRNA (guanine(527)-N(7))-methyltransferase RsmG [Solirubrobacteraceae bacterium]